MFIFHIDLHATRPWNITRRWSEKPGVSFCNSSFRLESSKQYFRRTKAKKQKQDQIILGIIYIFISQIDLHATKLWTECLITLLHPFGKVGRKESSMYKKDISNECYNQDFSSRFSKYKFNMYLPLDNTSSLFSLGSYFPFLSW